MKNIYIIGSITGYKYTSHSDIDVTVQIDPYDNAIGKTKWVKAINGQNAIGTTHPINYFLQGYYPDVIPEEAWKNYPFGVYDVQARQWLKVPPPRESVKDPQVQFSSEMLAGSMVDREFKRQITEFLRAESVLRAWSSLPRGSTLRQLEIDKKCREIEDRKKKLIAFADELDAGRKMVYRWGWGTPRYSYRNIVFKMIEHGKHGSLFEQLEPL